MNADRPVSWVRDWLNSGFSHRDICVHLRSSAAKIPFFLTTQPQPNAPRQGPDHAHPHPAAPGPTVSFKPSRTDLLNRAPAAKPATAPFKPFRTDPLNREPKAMPRPGAASEPLARNAIHRKTAAPPAARHGPIAPTPDHPTATLTGRPPPPPRATPPTAAPRRRRRGRGPVRRPFQPRPLHPPPIDDHRRRGSRPPPTPPPPPPWDPAGSAARKHRAPRRTRYRLGPATIGRQRQHEKAMSCGARACDSADSAGSSATKGPHQVALRLTTIPCPIYCSSVCGVPSAAWNRIGAGRTGEIDQLQALAQRRQFPRPRFAQGHHGRYGPAGRQPRHHGPAAY